MNPVKQSRLEELRQYTGQLRSMRGGAMLVSVLIHGGIFAVLYFVIRPALPDSLAEVERHVSIVTVSEFDEPPLKFADEAVSSIVGTVNEPQADRGPSLQSVLPTQTPPNSAMLPKLPGRLESTPDVPTVPATSLLGSRSGKRMPENPVADAIIADDRARLLARQPVGPPGEVSLFGSPNAEGRTFVFVIDRSHSMGSEGLDVLEKAERELVTAVSRLEVTHKIQIIAYNDRCTYLSRVGMVQCNPDGKASIAGFLTDLAAFGGTNHFQALLAAIVYQPDVVFLLTDGTDPILTDADIQHLCKLTKNRTRFYCLRFGETPAIGDDFMRKLAAQSGGAFKEIRK